MGRVALLRVGGLAQTNVLTRVPGPSNCGVVSTWSDRQRKGAYPRSRYSVVSISDGQSQGGYRDLAVLVRMPYSQPPSSESHCTVCRCPHCPAEFESRKEAQRHILTHAPARKPEYVCTACGKSFGSQGSMLHHMNRVHAALWHTQVQVCPWCSAKAHSTAGARGASESTERGRACNGT